MPATVKIKRHLDDNYAIQGGYEGFVKLLLAGRSDADIARHFSQDRSKEVSHQMVAYWRQRYLREQDQ